MSYDTYKNSLSRTPIVLVKVFMDQCSRTFGSSPCLASGTSCYNTFSTCKYLAAYALATAKEYIFSSADAPLPFKNGERPYIKAVKYLPAEIKDSITVSGRVTVDMYDELDADIGIDPYYATRTSRPGYFWRKFLARNPNFKGRRVEVYEGFCGLAVGDYALKFSGLIADIKISRGLVSIEVEDKLAKLKEIEIPAKIELENLSSSPAASTVIGIKSGDYTALASAGYIKINDNIIKYTGISDYYSNGYYYFTGCTWGHFGSTSTAVSPGDKITPVAVFLPDIPFTHLLTLIKWAGTNNATGYTDADIDLDAFAAYDRAQAPLGDGTPNYNGWRDWPKADINFSAVITEPTKLNTLLREISELLDARIWVNEASKITIRRNIPNKPGRAYHTITEAANIIENSQKVDLNDTARLTRVVVYWSQYILEKAGEDNSYRFKDTAIDADAEAAAGFGAQSLKTIYTRWINLGSSGDNYSLGCAPTVAPYETEALKIAYLTAYIKKYITRIVARFREAPTLLDLEVERQDEDILVGEYVKVSTGELQLKDGSDLEAWPFQVVRREAAGNKVKLKLQRAQARKILFLGATSSPVWTSATEAQKEYGYIGGESNLLSDGTDGYRIY